MFAQAARQRVPLRLLLCLLLVSVSGLLLFIRGFLLTRVEIAEVSQCAPVGSSSPAAHGAVDGCWVPRRFDTAVFVIIDAMRFDFAAPDAPVDAPWLTSPLSPSTGQSQSPQEVTHLSIEFWDVCTVAMYRKS